MDDKAEYCCEVNTKPSANGMQGDSEINCTQLIILGRSILNQGIRLESFLSQNDLYCIKWRLLHQTFLFLDGIRRIDGINLEQFTNTTIDC